MQYCSSHFSVKLAPGKSYLGISFCQFSYIFALLQFVWSTNFIVFMWNPIFCFWLLYVWRKLSTCKIVTQPILQICKKTVHDQSLNYFMIMFVQIHSKEHQLYTNHHQVVQRHAQIWNNWWNKSMSRAGF